MTTEPTPAHGPSESITATPPAPTAITATPVAPQPTPTTPAIGNTNSSWALRADYLLLGLVLVLAFFVASFAASNSDLWLHFATGRLISEGKFTFGVDPFSWATETPDGTPTVRWVHHSWLFSWIAYKAYEPWKMAEGLVVLKAILFTLAMGLLSRVGWQPANRWFVLICLLLAVLAASTRLFLDPSVISLLFLAATLYVLDRAGVFGISSDEPRRVNGRVEPSRWLWALPPLFLVWANLDAWFILGPIVLGLCWAASGLSRWFASVRELPGKQLGLVFGVGFVACLVNPFGVYVFQLPPELAYLLLAVADPIHLPLPDWLVAGGRTLKELRRLEPGFEGALSAVAPDYLWQRGLGWIEGWKIGFAGFAFYPLLLLGLLAFSLMAMVKPQAKAPSFHLARFMLWLVFAIMALSLNRLIPFFVLVAVPLTAMTLGEFVQWQQANAVTAEVHDRGLRLGRVASVPFVLLLLVLAWPGWLHGAREFNSARRVAWEVRENPSLKKAALTLHVLKEAGEGNNVFNADRQFGSVLPWFAPNVKHGMDTRLALFAEQAAPLTKVREALNKEKAEFDWQKVFKEHNVDQIAMVNFINSQSIERVLRFWVANTEWRQRFGDLRILILSWAPPERPWPPAQVSHDLNRNAFGEVAPENRPPAKGTPLPQSPGAFALYLDGISPTPTTLGEIDLLQERFGVINKLATGNAKPVRVFGLWSSLAPLQGMPGGMRLDLNFGLMYYAWYHAPQGGELGPPAAPVLMVRAARQAVAENPLDFRTHQNLMNVNETIRRVQEDRLIHYPPPGDPLGEARKNMAVWTQIFFEPMHRQPHPSRLRDRMRQVQQVVGAYNIVQLQPESHFHHDRLAKLYLQERLLDLALEHMEIAERTLETERPKDTERMKQFEGYAKGYKDEMAGLDKDVKQRLSKLKDLSVGKSAIQKAALANGAQFLGTPLALGKKALETLGSVKIEDLSPEERLVFVKMRFDLLISMGRVDVVAEALEDKNLQKNLPWFLYLEYSVLVAGALGNYDALDAVFDANEPMRQADLKNALAARDKYNLEGALHILASATQPNASGVAQALRVAPGFLHTIDASVGLQRLKAQYSDELTLHGIILLEAGKTKKARGRFEKALAEAPFFADRPIAERYLELLNEQKR